jgi:hypothetical protein
MGKFILVVAGLASALYSLAVSADGNYQVYVNDKYGYSVSYPTNLKPQPVSDSGDGRVFSSENGDAELRVYAGGCYESVDEYVAAYEKEQRAGHLAVTYTRKGRGFVVVSGLKKERIFYNKVLISGEGSDLFCTTLEFEYKQTAADKYRDATKRLSESLKAAVF